jgi:inner membrane protein
MDNVTHTLFALTLARTGLGQRGRGTMAALVIASNAPDIDIVMTAQGPLSYLQWHRGPTHGPAGILVLGIMTAWIVWMGRTYLDSRGRPPQGPVHNASIGVLSRLSVLGVFLHVAMDLATPYGTRILSPLSPVWVATDWMPIIEVYMLAILAAGLVLGWKPAVRRRAATIALTLVATCYGARAIAHRRAIAASPNLFGSLPPRCQYAAEPSSMSRWGQDGAARFRTGESVPCLADLAALPTFVSPFRWRIVARFSNGYEVREIDLLVPDADDRPLASRSREAHAVRVADEWTPAIERASRSRVGQVFLGFSRFPAAESVAHADGTTTVRWTDVRFVDRLPLPTPARTASTRTNFFTATVRIGAEGEVLEQRLGP